MALITLKSLSVKFTETLEIDGTTSIGTAVRMSDKAYKLTVYVPSVDPLTDTCYLAVQLPTNQLSNANIKVPADICEAFTLAYTDEDADLTYYSATFDITAQALKYVGEVKFNLVILHDTGDTETTTVDGEEVTTGVFTKLTSGTFTLNCTRSSDYEEVLYPEDEDDYEEAVEHIDSIIETIATYKKNFVTHADTIYVMATLPSSRQYGDYVGQWIWTTDTHKLVYVISSSSVYTLDVGAWYTKCYTTDENRFTTIEGNITNLSNNKANKTNGTLTNPLITGGLINSAKVGTELDDGNNDLIGRITINTLVNSGVTTAKSYADGLNASMKDYVDEKAETHLTRVYQELDTTNYILKTVSVQSDGTEKVTSEIDLPLESAIVSISYDETEKDLIFTLRNGTTTNVPLDALVEGLAKKSDYEAWVTTIESKITELNTLESSVESAETTRASNEVTRQSQETTRQSNEATRQTNESTRTETFNTQISSLQSLMDDLNIEDQVNSKKYTWHLRINAEGKPQLVYTTAE